MAGQTVDVLIVGGGITGLLLARELRQRGRTVLVASDPARSSASEAAVGLLNPVRGRRCTVAWRAAESFAAARSVYQKLAEQDGRFIYRDVTIVRAFSSADERASMERRLEAIATAGFRVDAVDTPLRGLRASEFGAVRITGGGALDVRAAVLTLRRFLAAVGALVAKPCRVEELEFGSGPVRWTAGGCSAERVVLAGGAWDGSRTGAGAMPLRPVHGESLVLRAPGLSPDFAYVSGHHLAPLGGDSWACGGTKLPGSASWEPTPAGRAELVAFLHDHVTVPWEITAHLAGVRAATLDTKPILGPLAGEPHLYAFNGFGSQGVALGPWLAGLMADHLVRGDPIPREIASDRFAQAPQPCASGTQWHAVDVAHAIAASHLAPGDFAIDLTAGTGGDTVWLAETVGSEGAVLAIDLQPEAIEATRRRLLGSACETPVELRCGDHARLRAWVPAAWERRVGAVIANLGYLPGSASGLSTQAPTTVAAFTAALELLRPGGVLVAVLYTHHPGGTAELAAAEQWAATLDAGAWRVSWHRAPDRPSRAPVVLGVVAAGFSQPG